MYNAAVDGIAERNLAHHLNNSTREAALSTSRCLYRRVPFASYTKNQYTVPTRGTTGSHSQPPSCGLFGIPGSRGDVSRRVVAIRISSKYTTPSETDGRRETHGANEGDPYGVSNMSRDQTVGVVADPIPANEDQSEVEPECDPATKRGEE